MGCNAWNHPAYCECGWGGDGHLGGGGGWGSGAFTSLIRKDWTLPHSLTTPNSICPVCSARVFFYQNSTGSKVFFDALGPPWPKHSCTDTGGATITRHSTGWSAGVIRRVSQMGATSLRTIYLEVHGGIKPLFINDKAGLLEVGLPAYLFENGGYKLSAAVPLRGGVQIVSVRAFGRAMDALKCKSEPKQAEPKTPRQPWDTPDAPEQAVPQVENLTERPQPTPAAPPAAAEAPFLAYGWPRELHHEAARLARLVVAVAAHFSTTPDKVLDLIKEDLGRWPTT